MNRWIGKLARRRYATRTKAVPDVCDDENYLSKGELPPLKQQGWRVYQIINGYIRYLRDRKAGASLALHESSPAYGFMEDDLDAIFSPPPESRFNDSTV